MSAWRSEDMILVQLTMQREVAHDTVEKLGDLGMVEFKDLSSHLNAFQRQYAGQVKRCEELERRLRYFEEQMKGFKDDELESSSINGDNYGTMDEYSQSASDVTIDSMETVLESHEEEVRQLNDNLERLQTDKNNAEEQLQVINLGAKIFRESGGGWGSESSDTSGDNMIPNRDDIEATVSNNAGSRSLNYLTGVIARDKLPTFNVLLYRATRGNIVPRFAEVPGKLMDNRTGNLIEKDVFILFFGANRAKEKIKKICESMGASIYDIPEGEPTSTEQQLQQSIHEYENTIDTSKGRKLSILGEVYKNLMTWKKKIAKEKAIYHTMNLFDYKIQNSVIAEGWIPKKSFDAVIEKMKEAEQSANAQVGSYCEEIPTKETRPTYFENNQFTECFQDISNSYGIPRYKEMNPAVPSIVTFPFLFAVMFGDWGHALVILLFASAMIIFQRKLYKVAEDNELFGMIFHGRFMMLLMSLFSIYTGLLYNDVFSLQLNLFGTAYEFKDHQLEGNKIGSTYVFGVDPAWFGTTNKLGYYNSVKMKMAIIFGVGQMMLGIFMSALNHIQFRHFEDILFEFIPEVLLLGCTFGYMSFMIIYKWCIDWVGLKLPAPSLLNTMTDFFLHPWALQQPELFPGQVYLQMVLLGIAAICVPWLFFPKPIYEIIHHYRHKKHTAKAENYDTLTEETNTETNNDAPTNDEVTDNADISITVDKSATGRTQQGSSSAAAAVSEKSPEKHGEPAEEEFNASEVFIKQLIHTIEFALGTVSNTASYLRLWALSLAHSQLSEVFWDMTVKMLLTLNFESAPWFATYFIDTGLLLAPVFLIWFLLTLGVLIGMEALSAFLHALRLHWVEFDSKFFIGDGHLFTPFSLAQVEKDTERGKIDGDE